jgi:hypothetical protein
MILHSPPDRKCTPSSNRLDPAMTPDRVAHDWGHAGNRLFNIGMLLDAMGSTAEAVSYLEQSVAMMEDIGHPELKNARAALERVLGKLGNGCFAKRMNG